MTPASPSSSAPSQPGDNASSATEVKGEQVGVPAPPPPQDDEAERPTFNDCALVSAGSAAAATEAAREASSPQTAAGAAAPLSEPALETAPQGEDGPLISEADPTSNAG